MDVTLNGHRCHYTESGSSSGLPVVFIHGFPFNQASWAPQLDALPTEIRAITYDIRGHGKSAVGDGHYTIELFVDDLLALLDHLGIDAAVLCGLSMGGYIALRAAERDPGRVRAMILCDTQSASDSNAAKLGRAAAIRQIQTAGTTAFVDGLLPKLFTAESIRTGTAAVDLIRRMMQATDPLAITGTLLALAGRTDTSPALPQMDQPALLLFGEEDPITPPDSGRQMLAALPHATLELIPRAAHVSNLENPDDFNRHVLSFLGKIV